MNAQLRSRIRRRRRGSAYLLVLGSAMIVAIIGLSSLTVARIHRRAAGSAANANEARLNARSAVEACIGATAFLADWRTSGYVSGEVVGPLNLGDGTCSVKIVDEIDGDLANDPDQQVRITTTGQVGSAVYHYTVLAEPPALSCLQAAVHAVGGLAVESGDTLTVTNGPAFCSFSEGLEYGLVLVWSAATIDGDAAADTVENYGEITGDITENALPKELPASSTVAYYVSQATVITRSAIGGDKIEKVILSHISNPYGAVNPDGLYYIDSEGHPIQIEECRIEGTLVVDMAADKKLEIKKGIVWQPHRSDYPALIVTGGEEVELEIEYPLDEDGLEVNFNPAGLPYEGQEDSDQDDVYESVIKGLIHIVDAPTELKKTTRVEGAILVEGIVTVKDTVTVVYDANLALNPPKRYRASRLNILPGTWRRVLSP